MPARTEIHFHLLPGVDDGPATMADSIALALAAIEDGTSCVVTTPHVGDVTIAELPERLEELRAALAEADVPLDVMQGGELAPWEVDELSDAELSRIAVGPAGARWALLEAPTVRATIDDIHAAAEALRGRGTSVVLGHPERSPALTGPGGDEAIERELERGTVLQVNAPSLLGVYGRDVRDAAERIVAAWRDACVVSSDAHSPDRPPLLSEGWDAVARLAGDATARELVDDGPRRLIEAGILRGRATAPPAAWR